MARVHGSDQACIALFLFTIVLTVRLSEYSRRLSMTNCRVFETANSADYKVRTAVEREPVLRLASPLWRLRRATAGRGARVTADVSWPILARANPVEKRPEWQRHPAAVSKTT